MRKDTMNLRHRRSDSHRTDGSACIILIYGGELGRRYPLVADFTIGRDDDNEIVADLTTVSRHHAKLFDRNGIWFIRDLGSTNGTAINGREIHEETPLSNGDLLRLGGMVFKFIDGDNVEALYHEEIYRLTILDGLTGVHNRRYFQEYIERETVRAIRHDRPLSLAMIDIDHFKELNDRHGHVVGDQVLQVFAQLISDSMRQDELLARYGGEEFVVVLPETGVTDARKFCERIRRLVENQVYEVESLEIKITISLGVATLKPGQSVDDFVKAADDLLYRAKEAGRNRVVGEA